MNELFKAKRITYEVDAICKNCRKIVASFTTEEDFEEDKVTQVNKGNFDDNDGVLTPVCNCKKIN
jgi:hypothetical protein